MNKYIIGLALLLAAPVFAQVTQTSAAIDPLIPREVFVDSRGIEQINKLVVDAAALTAAANSEVSLDVAEVTQTVTLRGDATIQAVNKSGESVAGRKLVRVWFAETALAAPSATNNTVDVTTGTSIEAVLANAHLLVLTDAAGKIEINVTIVGAESRFLMAEVNGVVTSTELEIAVIE